MHPQSAWSSNNRGHDALKGAAVLSHPGVSHHLATRQRELDPETTDMKKKFKVGDRVTWNSEAGYVSGVIVNVHTKDVE